MIKSLQSLRGIFAIVIICYHYYSRSPMIVDATACGVSFFFIMSGFALALHHPVDSLKDFSLKNFMRDRLAKLYPLHLVLTLAMIYLAGINWKLLANVLLIQSWFTSESVWFSYNGISWFVASLVFCYLFFHMFSYWSRRLKPAVTAGILCIATLLMTGAFMLIPSSIYSWFYYVLPVTRLIDFGLGVFLATIYSRAKASDAAPTTSTASFFALVAIILVMALIAWPHHTPFARVAFLSFVWYAPLALLIFALGMAEHENSVLTRLLSWKPLVWIGGISFEMYMLQLIVHCFVCKLGVICVGHKFNPELHIAIIIALVIPLAWLTQRYFTTPVARWLKRHH
ncbi:MAG: acyltransferase [Muribaculaceae bacterium]|nr:acyltransferase [Muribaculaceae bacterium]